MAKRYRYAFVKKQEARKGKLSTGLAAASLVLFLAAVMLACVFNGEMGYCRRHQPFCNAAVCVWFYYGAAEFFGNRQKSSYQYDRIYFKWYDHDWLAGNVSAWND